MAILGGCQRKQNPTAAPQLSLLAISTMSERRLGRDGLRFGFLSRLWYKLNRRRVRPDRGWGRTEEPNAFPVSEARMSAPTRADWPLLALSVADDGTLTPVQMQKVLFLLDQQAHDRLGDNFYIFRPHNYGPFSSLIYDDLEQHALEGRIVFDNQGGRWSNYVITGLGEEYLEDIEADIDLYGYLGELVRWAKSLRFSELVGAIYQAYPDFAKNSIFSP